MLVSIITPLYNAAQYLAETFASVKQQTLQDFEWIIVDDCSADGSFEIALSLAEGSPNIRVFRLDQNGGSAKARNYALDRAQGKYVTFLDADDLLDPTYLENQVSFIQEHGPIVSAAYRRMTDNSTTVFYVPDLVTYKSIIKGNPLSCLSTMYDKTVFPDERFPEDMDRHEDYVFWANMLKKGYEAHGNPEVLATYRLIRTSKNSNKVRLVVPMIKAYHQKFGFSFIHSLFATIRYVFYSKKKYRGAF